MKTLRILSLIIVFLLSGTLMSQNKEAPQSRSIEALMDSKNFEFIAHSAIPLSMPIKNLVGSGYSVIFSQEEIISVMPFYGRAYSGVNMGKNKGMRFQGKPEVYTIEKSKEFQVNVEVKDGDTYKLTLRVGNSGFATLHISSNDRETISYRGEVVGID